MEICSPAAVIGNRIEELCVNKSKFCKKVGISAELFRRALNGDRRFTGEELINICQALDLTLDDFVESD